MQAAAGAVHRRSTSSVISRGPSLQQRRRAGRVGVRSVAAVHAPPAEYGAHHGAQEACQATDRNVLPASREEPCQGSLGGHPEGQHKIGPHRRVRSSRVRTAVLRRCSSIWSRIRRQAQADARRSGGHLGGQYVSWARVLAMGLVVPALPGDPVNDMLSNRVLITGFWAWFLAQFGKIFTKRFKKGVWDIRAVVEPGGMPSSHSSLCSGVTTAVALHFGLGSPLFAISLAFSVIVMYDAMGVRQHAGKQAEVLNQVINELMENHPVVGEIKLKEVLGHTPRQVVCGALLGFITALLFPTVSGCVTAA